ncbi:MAG TPA: RsmD family RNA methyltransferase, partial [Solirubrobacteraceae bacterium]|nr:RsmD family RNA methyltransferase [Solirubrobacteraceae bacterium]
LGIEALSRGAQRALFVERDAAALGVLERNLEDLGLTPPGAEIHRGEARVLLRTARDRGDKYDLIFIDPPYGDAREWERELAVDLPPLLALGGRVVVESDRRSMLDLPLEVERERRYGDTSIRIHRNP